MEEEDARELRVERKKAAVAAKENSEKFQDLITNVR